MTNLVSMPSPARPLDDLDIRLSRAYATMLGTVNWINSCVEVCGSIEAMPDSLKADILNYVMRHAGGLQ